MQIAKTRLFLTSDRKALVHEDSPKAATLYAAVGDEIPDSAVELFGLVDGDLKPALPAKPVEKEKVPGENKEKAPAEKKAAAKKPAAKKAAAPAAPAEPAAPEAPAAPTGDAPAQQDA